MNQYYPPLFLTLKRIVVCPSKSVLLPLFATALACQSASAVDNEVAKSSTEAEPADEYLISATIVTAQRMQSSLRAHSGSIAILDNSALDLIGHSHIQESLNRLAGINFHRNNGQEYLPAVRSPVLTGPGACGGFLVMENGVPIRPNGFCNVNELFETHSEQAQRLEVIRGPGTAFHGSNALHGLIHVLNAAEINRPSSLFLQEGPHDFSQLGLSLANDTWGLALTTAHDGGYRDESGYDQQKLSVRHASRNKKLEVITDFTATNLNQETAGFAVGKDAYKGSQLSKVNPNPEAYRDASSARLSSKITFANDLQITPYARYSEMAFLQHFLPGTPLEENGHHSIGLLSHWQYPLNEQLLVQAGVDLEYADVWLKETQAEAVSGSPFLAATIPLGKHYDYQVNSLLTAPFARIQWQPADALSLTFGLRFEHQQYDYNNRMLSGRTREDGSDCGFGGCRFSRPEDNRDSFSNLSPKLGLVYQLAKHHQLRAHLARGFRVPQMTELYRLQREQLQTDLDPETITNIELGIRGRWQQLSYDIALYQMKKDNVILRDTSFFNISDGKTRHRGLELAVGYNFNPHWDLGLSTSFARHRYDNNPGLSTGGVDGNDVDTAPRHFGNLRLGYSPNQSIRGELELSHMGRYYTDPENLHHYEGHDIINLRLHWQITPRLGTTLKVLNLTNREYAERADYSGFVGERYFPGEPRGVYLRLNYQLAED